MHKQAVTNVKFLSGRDNQFYANILPKLKTMRAVPGEIIIRQNTSALQCFIVIDGSVVNMVSKRKYGPGSIFGITDIVYNRKRMENFVAETKTSLLVSQILY